MSLAFRAWAESWVAVIGLTLVCFWLLMAVTAPYLPLLDPNKPVAPCVTPFTEKNGIFYWLGTDTRGRDMLSRIIWGSQRVIVWGITATTVAYVVGTMLRARSPAISAAGGTRSSRSSPTCFSPSR